MEEVDFRKQEAQIIASDEIRSHILGMHFALMWELVAPDDGDAGCGVLCRSSVEKHRIVTEFEYGLLETEKHVAAAVKAADSLIAAGLDEWAAKCGNIAGGELAMSAVRVGWDEGSPPKPGASTVRWLMVTSYNGGAA